MKNELDKYEKVKQKYTLRKRLSFAVIAAGLAVLGLTVLFVFVETLEPTPSWNRFHNWAAGLGALLITAGSIFLASNITALKDIEKTVNRLNPDERELAIKEKAQAKALKIYMWIIFPVIFVAASVLVMLEYINFIAWIIINVSFLSLLITYAFVRRNEDKKF